MFMFGGSMTGGVQIRIKDEAVRFLSVLCSKSTVSAVVGIASS